MLNEQLKTTLCSLAHAIALHYGKSCEVAIHDLTGRNAADSSIIYIENGEVTGRSVGDGASAVVLEELSQAEQTREDRVGYFTKTTDGKVLKSTTVYIRDDKGKAIAIFSINHDITALSVAAASLTELTAPATASEPEKITPQEAVTFLRDSHAIKFIVKGLATNRIGAKNSVSRLAQKSYKINEES